MSGPASELSACLSISSRGQLLRRSGAGLLCVVRGVQRTRTDYLIFTFTLSGCC